MTLLTATITAKRYGGRLVIDRLTIALGQSEIVALVGPSGCGKSTFLRIVAGLDSDFEGRLDWAGQARPRIGMVFQEPRLLPWRTVRQNLDLVLDGSDHEDPDALLRSLGLWNFRDAYPGRLSLGMQRRVSIARAFVVKPALLLLDEPFVSLDQAMVRASRRALLDTWQRHRAAAILVTHDESEARELADRVIVLTPSPARIESECAPPPRAAT